MPWPFWSKPAPTTSPTETARDEARPSPAAVKPPQPATPTTSPSRRPHSPISWNDSLSRTDWEHYAEPRNWIPTLLVTATALGALQFYRSYLRRIPGTAHIAPGFFRRRSLLGRVTSVGDGDNFHLFHTPGGRLAGWGWLRSVPANRADLKGRTIPIRIAGIDAPEGAHFGRPAQPYSAEALQWLNDYIRGRRVRCRIWRRDQYDRVVATVHVRRALLRRDVGLEMLRRGLATTYDAKTGAEFGGAAVEARYRAAEETARRKGVGMWADEKKSWFGLGGPKGTVETPREYKTRMNEAEKAKEAEKGSGATKGSKGAS